METKHLTAPLEIKSLDEGGYFDGYASVFGVQDFDGDVIIKGAFSESIKRATESGRMPKMLWQHNPSHIIGKWLEMREDERGVYVKGRLIMEVQKGREAYALMKEGQLDAMSVGFNITQAGDGSRGRVIELADLWEISLVTWGANPEARIEQVKSIRFLENLLRDAGYSQKQAKAIAADGYKAAFDDQRDVDTGSEAETIEVLKSLNAKIKGAIHG